jgi:outer membrane protein
MFKKFAIAIVMFVLPLGAMAQSKLAHMNSQEIIVEMQEYKDAVTSLQNREKGYQDELTRISEEFQKKYQEYIAQADSLPRNIAERREKELSDMQQRAQEFQQEAQQAMQQAQQEVMNPILQKVSDAVQAIGKADGYTYVIDLANSSVTYVGTDAIDITAKIKAQLGIK